ncbi:hypothetical protein NDA13_001908 [Ustilago tritici]|nr:hypothetical protein NDA13_001908 [Ustilago tritici]
MPYSSIPIVSPSTLNVEPNAPPTRRSSRLRRRTRELIDFPHIDDAELGHAVDAIDQAHQDYIDALDVLGPDATEAQHVRTYGILALKWDVRNSFDFSTTTASATIEFLTADALSHAEPLSQESCLAWS